MSSFLCLKTRYTPGKIRGDKFNYYIILMKCINELYTRFLAELSLEKKYGLDSNKYGICIINTKFSFHCKSNNNNKLFSSCMQ